jgi:SHS2 domain-containing protein
MPFEEIQHTADWSLRVWAANLSELFAEAARGMTTLAGTRLVASPRTNRTIETSAPDIEGLLVSFLSEILYLSEEENLAFDEFKIQIEENRLSAEISGASIRSIDKTIKAVTYHNLLIQQTPRGFEVEIVFDV